MPKHDLIKFFKKSLLFLPLAAILCIPFIVLWASGEMVSPQHLIQTHQDRNRLSLYGTAYTSFNPYYKLHYTIAARPDIIALGDSRIMEMRSCLFKKDNQFFNAFGAIFNMNDFRRFLNLLPQDYNPKIIIVGLDHSFFNPKFNASFKNADFNEPPPLGNIQNVLRAMLKDYIAGKFTLKDLWGSKRNRGFGLNAIENNNGFRNDGSHYSGKIIEDPQGAAAQNRFKDSWESIINGTSRFPYSSDFSAENVQELRELLNTCASRNIYVIGILPPFTHRSFEKLKSMGNKHGYIFKLAPILSELFDEFHFGFFDFSDLDWIGAADEEATDEYHGSEKAFVRLFIKMIRQDTKLAAYARSPVYLEERLRAAQDPFLVFRKDEF